MNTTHSKRRLVELIRRLEPGDVLELPTLYDAGTNQARCDVRYVCVLDRGFTVLILSAVADTVHELTAIPAAVVHWDDEQHCLVDGATRTCVEWYSQEIGVIHGERPDLAQAFTSNNDISVRLTDEPPDYRRRLH
jgi:hypothetical protein